jgi:hypothetical protein
MSAAASWTTCTDALGLGGSGIRAALHHFSIRECRLVALFFCARRVAGWPTSSRWRHSRRRERGSRRRGARRSRTRFHASNKVSALLHGQAEAGQRVECAVPRAACGRDGFPRCAASEVWGSTRRRRGPPTWESMAAVLGELAAETTAEALGGKATPPDVSQQDRGGGCGGKPPPHMLSYGNMGVGIDPKIMSHRRRRA